MSDEGSGARHCGSIIQRYGFRPSSEAIEDGEQVCVNLRGWQGSNNIDVDVLKTV